MSLILDGENNQKIPTGQNVGEYITEATTDNFETEVLQASMEKPVIVDLWAPWCGPCQQLMPLLEKVVMSFKGAVKLVKINADENQEIAAALRVQSLPTVMALYKGQPIDGFMGVQPENTLRTFIDNVLKAAGIDAFKDINAMLDKADTLREEGLYDQAMTAYMQAMDEEGHNARAIAGLGMCFLDQDDIDGAKELLKSVSPELYEESEIKKFRHVLRLKESAGSHEDIERLQQQVLKNPDEHKLKLDLAEKQFAHGYYEQSFNTLLSCIEKDPDWQEGAAKKKLFDLFNTLGQSHPATITARRKLSSQLFC